MKSEDELGDDLSASHFLTRQKKTALKVPLGGAAKNETTKSKPFDNRIQLNLLDFSIFTDLSRS